MADQNVGQAASGQGANQGKVPYNLVFAENATKAGSYANVGSVHVNKNEVILDFGYMVAGANPPEVMITSRINMNHNVAAQFMTIMQNAMLDFKNKVDKARAEQANKQTPPPAA